MLGIWLILIWILIRIIQLVMWWTNSRNQIVFSFKSSSTLKSSKLSLLFLSLINGIKCFIFIYTINLYQINSVKVKQPVEDIWSPLWEPVVQKAASLCTWCPLEMWSVLIWSGLRTWGQTAQHWKTAETVTVYCRLCCRHCWPPGTAEEI